MTDWIRIPTRWRAILQPWRMHLQQMGEITRRLCMDDYEWVHVDLGVASTKRNWRENVRRSRELLELLAIIVIAESASDGEMPQEVCDSPTPALLTPTMKEMVKKHWRLPVGLFMTPGRHGQDVSVAYLKSAVDLAKAVVERMNQENGGALRHDSGQWQYRFLYTDLRATLHFSSFNLEQGAASILTELIAVGVCQSGDIDVSNKSALGRLPISELGPILHAILDGSSLRAMEGYEKSLSGKWRGLSLKNWNPDGAWDARLLEAVCSSLTVCKDFKKLKLSYMGGRSSPESRKKVLQWLAYALFSKESKISITSLTITHADLKDEDVVPIIDVLEATNPAKKLLDFQDEEKDGSSSTEDNGGDKDPGFSSLKAGTAITIKSINDETQLGVSPESISLKQDGPFRVIRDDKRLEWVDMIVPHYGYCVVPRASVDHFAPAASSDAVPVGYHGLVTSLTIRDSNHEALLPLIDFIGPKLLLVGIGIKYGDTIKIDFLRHFVSACLNLKSLELWETEKGILSVFMEAYASGKCTIEYLSFYCFLTGDGDFLIPSAGHDLYKGNVFAALAEMLQVNRTIEYLEIDMYQDLYEEHEAAMMRTDGQCIRQHPLSLASRYAFLSVVKYHTPSQSIEPPRKRARLNGQTDDADLGRLNRTAVSSIFAFAVEVSAASFISSPSMKVSRHQRDRQCELNTSTSLLVYWLANFPVLSRWWPTPCCMLSTKASIKVCEKSRCRCPFKEAQILPRSE